jgi:hypothetical protein
VRSGVPFTIFSVAVYDCMTVFTLIERPIDAFRSRKVLGIRNVF